ncbi:hypothetical protein Egran_00351 [Elaphomyces granulatus]|uniref:Mediator of RNA polymerase II transcription subunit 20 n=1 Tax=Elaphomyces granulatus TaxID=519963 RepID=A0A232M6Z5_9EURO|nr:hypothetical protein Egran_00351 [Elaphomyces granulatus]
MPVTGVFFIPTNANASTSLTPLIDRLRSVFGEELTLVARFNLGHNLLRDTPSCLPASAHSPNPPPKARYIQLLFLNHYPSHGFLYTTEPEDVPGNNGNATPSNAARIPSTLNPSNAAAKSPRLVMSTIPRPSYDTIYQHFMHACEPLWCHRHTVTVSGGFAFDVGDFRVRLGDVKQTQPMTRLRGTVVEIEWRGPSLTASSPFIFDHDEGNNGETFVDSAIGPEEEYASGAQLIREFWSRLRGDGIAGVREAILVPDMGKELKAQARRQEIRRRMGGKTAAEGNGGWGSSEQEDDPDPIAGVDLARQYMEIFRFNR